MVVKVQGFKPENVLFLVHEVFESLVQQSYSGVHYDFAIPCMDCQAEVDLSFIISIIINCFQKYSQGHFSMSHIYILL